MTPLPQSEPVAKPDPDANSTDVPPASVADHHPLLSVIGAFESDPEYNALMEDVYEYRRQLDARESQDAG